MKIKLEPREPFTAAQIDSTLLLARLDRKHPKGNGKEDCSDEHLRNLLLKVSSAYRREVKTSSVVLDANDEKVLGKTQLAQKFSKIFLRSFGEGREVTFHLNPTFASQLVKQIQSEEYRQEHRTQTQDRRAARMLKRESMLKSSLR